MVVMRDRTVIMCQILPIYVWIVLNWGSGENVTFCRNHKEEELQCSSPEEQQRWTCQDHLPSALQRSLCQGPQVERAGLASGFLVTFSAVPPISWYSLGCVWRCSCFQNPCHRCSKTLAWLQLTSHHTAAGNQLQWLPQFLPGNQAWQHCTSLARLPMVKVKVIGGYLAFWIIQYKHCWIIQTISPLPSCHI